MRPRTRSGHDLAAAFLGGLQADIDAVGGNVEDDGDLPFGNIGQSRNLGERNAPVTVDSGSA